MICVEYFAWGKHGGFGKATRLLAQGLADQGHEVTAFVPRRAGQKVIEWVDGVRVYGFSPWAPRAAFRFLRGLDVDLFHSSEPSMATVAAMRIVPEAAHLITVRDPRDLPDWLLEFRYPSLNRLQVFLNFLYESNPWVKHSLRQASGVFATAPGLRQKIRRLYSLSYDPLFLPTPVQIPKREVSKAATPEVCYLGRLDRRKRPERFCLLASRLPEVRFHLIGKSRDRAVEKQLRQRFGGLPNLEFHGFLDPFHDDALERLLAKAWVVVNTSVREGLPNVYLEAAAHRCALLGSIDTDGFLSRFGAWVHNDDFEGELQGLLEADRWREKGEAGFDFVRKTFATQTALAQHLSQYQRACSGVEASCVESSAYGHHGTDRTTTLWRGRSQQP